MKIDVQKTPELSQLCKLIQNIAVAMMTTHDALGALVSRPMVPLEMDATGALWFFTDKRSDKVEHLQEVNLGFADVGQSIFVSLSGSGEIHADQARVDRLWTPFAKPWFPDGPESSHLALLKFTPRTAEYWDAPHGRMARMFAMAASVAAGRPVSLGTHDTLTGLSAPP